MMFFLPKTSFKFFFFFFFFNDTATTEIYTLSLHDALPIFDAFLRRLSDKDPKKRYESAGAALEDRKSTRLNSSHDQISYAVFCLKKKKNMALTMISVWFLVCETH